MDAALAEGAIRLLLAMVFVSGAFIVTRRDLLSLVTTYSVQSLLISLLALVLWAVSGTPTLLIIAAITFFSKVVYIPNKIRQIQRRMNIERDFEFKYISPSGMILATMALILLVYYAFSGFLRDLAGSNLFYMGSVFGVSLAMMGMLVTFSRRKIVTKTIGYLTMENGVILFGIFLAELPLIIEVLVMLDLIILVVLATVLSVGIDSSIEEFQARLHPFQRRDDD
jgi:hydrogenase-4 component E